MEISIACYLWAMSIGVVFVLARSHMRGASDIYSLHSVFLAGFVLFQLSSAAYSLVSQKWGWYYVDRPAIAGLTFAIYATIFYIVLEITYRLKWGVPHISRAIPQPKRFLSDGGLMGLAVVLLIFGEIVFPLVPPSLIQKITSTMSLGFTAASCGLVGWVIAYRWKHFGLLVVGGSVLIGAISLNITGFSRREVVAILAAFLWGVYYRRLRYVQPNRLIWVLIVLFVITSFPVALLTSVRDVQNRSQSITERISTFASEGDIIRGYAVSLDGQMTGAGSMWAIETHPDVFEYRHLFSITYFITYPVPRHMWPGKPISIAHEAPVMLGERKEVGSLSLPVGIIGNAGAEGGLYAAVIYAILIGLYLRLFDEYARNNLANPLSVIPLSASLGQILGMPRGEPSQFAFLYLISFTGIWLVMLAIGRVIGTYYDERQYRVWIRRP